MLYQLMYVYYHIDMYSRIVNQSLLTSAIDFLFEKQTISFSYHSRTSLETNKLVVIERVSSGQGFIIHLCELNFGIQFVSIIEG